MRKIQMHLNNPFYLGLSILDLSTTVMYKFWDNFIKPKSDENTKLCYMDTDSFIVHVNTGDIYKDIVEDVGKEFEISNFELDRPLSKGKIKKVV